MQIDKNNLNKFEIQALVDLIKTKKKFLKYHSEYIQRNIKHKFFIKIEEVFEDILNFRKRWRIDKYNIQTSKDCIKWWRDQVKNPPVKKTHIVYFEEEYIVHIKNFEKIFINFAPFQPGKRKKIKVPWSLKNQFIYEIEELMADCNIDSFFFYPFEYYILYQEINMNLLFNPLFSLIRKRSIGSGNRVLYDYWGVIIGPNTRLKDLKTFAFPLLKYYQIKMPGYIDDSEYVTKSLEQHEKLGPKYAKKQKQNTWLVSSGYINLKIGKKFDKSKKKENISKEVFKRLY